MQLPALRKKVFSLTNSLISALPQANVARTNFVAFHSTPATCEKSKSKGKSEAKRIQKPSKKRADTEQDLKDPFFNSGAPKNSFQDEGQRRFDYETENQDDDGCDKEQKSKLSSRRGGKSQSNKMKCDDIRYTVEISSPGMHFRASTTNASYAWSIFKGATSKSSTFSFESRERSNKEYQKSKKWENMSDAKSEDEQLNVGSHSDRTILGLPPTGPFKMEDVKKAFRLSALKWHPDKHQEVSRAATEEKFKLCVNAYKSLCAALNWNAPS